SRGPANCRTARLPATAVDDLVERAAVEPLERGERPVGRIAQRHQVGAEPVVGEAEDPTRKLLILNRRMAGADAEIGGHEHHRHRRVPQVVLQEAAPALVLRDRRDDRDRGGCTGDMPGSLPDARELSQLLAVGHDDEVPRLPVLRRRRKPAGLQDPPEVGLAHRPRVELTDVSARPQRVPGLHAGSLSVRRVDERRSRQVRCNRLQMSASTTIRTMDDIARLAGVSKSTVSRALSDSPLIAVETKERIRAIAREHRFQLNAPARRLSLKRSRAVALVLYGKDDTFFSPDVFMLEIM